jgi:hypothetical protein
MAAALLVDFLSDFLHLALDAPHLTGVVVPGTLHLDQLIFIAAVAPVK